MKIADHAALIENVVRHDAQGLADARQQAEQIVGRALAFAREAAQVAKQDGDLRCKHKENNDELFHMKVFNLVLSFS